MKLSAQIKNSIVFLAWCFLVVFAFTFNNHSNWILLFFITTLMIALVIMLFLPINISMEGLSKEMTLTHKEALEVRIYTRTHVRFRLLNIQLNTKVNNMLIQSELKMLPTKKHEILAVNTHILNRGIYEMNSLQLNIRDFIGLMERRVIDDTLKDLIICPKINKSGPFVAEYLDRKFNIQAPYKNRETFDVKLIREYNPGDRMNRIDWKLSSKTNTLIYREYEHENDKPVIFIFVAEDHANAEWMLSLFYTLDVNCFNGTTLQFGLLGNEYIPNPINRDYAELKMCDDFDVGSVRHDAILFSPKRLNLIQNTAQIYCDKQLVVFEQNGVLDIIGEFDESGELK